MSTRQHATACKQGGGWTPVESRGGTTVGLDSKHILPTLCAADRASRVLALSPRRGSLKGLMLRRGLIRSPERIARGRVHWASHGDLTSGEEEPGNEQPISTWRASPTGRPRQSRPSSPLRLFRHAGLPGKCARSASPLPARSPSGEGAEGEGRLSAARPLAASRRSTPRALPFPDRARKHTGTDGDRCPFMTASKPNSVAAEWESTSKAEPMQARRSRSRTFGPQKGPNDDRPR
jgi:hypothetical protein